MSSSEAPGPSHVKDPVFLRRVVTALLDADYAEVLRLSADVGVVPPDPADAGTWRYLAYSRVLALVHGERVTEAHRLAERCLQETEGLDDESRMLTMNASIWPAYLEGHDGTALRRLDEVLAYAEAADNPRDLVGRLAHAATAAGSIGFTEVYDDLLGRVCAMIDLAPPGAVDPALVRYLKTAQIAARFSLALTSELDGSDAAEESYRGARELCERAVRGDWAPGGVPKQSTAYYLACLAHIGVVLGDAPAPAGPAELVDPTAPVDLLELTTATIEGLTRLRARLDHDDPAAGLRTAEHLTAMARRGRGLVLEAEASRLQVRHALTLGDPALVAARRERFEEALARLDWRGRLQRAQLMTRSRTLADHLRP